MGDSYPRRGVDGQGPGLGDLLALGAFDFVQDVMGEPEALLGGPGRFKVAAGPLGTWPGSLTPGES
jgi:hypothetical protein